MTRASRRRLRLNLPAAIPVAGRRRRARSVRGGRSVVLAAAAAAGAILVYLALGALRTASGQSTEAGDADRPA